MTVVSCVVEINVSNVENVRPPISGWKKGKTCCASESVSWTLKRWTLKRMIPIVVVSFQEFFPDFLAIFILLS